MITKLFKCFKIHVGSKSESALFGIIENGLNDAFKSAEFDKKEKDFVLKLILRSLETIVSAETLEKVKELQS